MACSPMSLKSGEILSFEKEEELILSSIEKFPVSITVEDSGSCAGLEEILFELNGADIVHITGHAGIDPVLGPVFYMENDIGDLEKVTPDLLWKSLKHFPPRLLFLSGCLTGAADNLNNNKDNAAVSFAHQMVCKGISTVLGWGLPVSDNGATLFAGELYKILAKGKGTTESISSARKKINEQNRYHPWPLLRVFNDGLGLTPLIAPGQKLQRTPSRKATYKYLSDNKVRVLEKGFVGRRREIQRGAKILKGAIAGRYGIIIHGTAGIGKSCLAGKLIDRFHQKELLVIHGVITVAELFQKLESIFDRKGLKTGIEILKSNAEVEDKIKALFRTTFKELPVLLYFDDFEQNLERLGNDYLVKTDILPVISTILTALDWGEGTSNLIITSCYPFNLEDKGIDLPKEKLEDVPLISFTGADLEKKKNELKFISQSANSSLYMEGGKGNPRLLEWMEIIAEDEKKYDIQSLSQEIKGKNEEFISKYLAEVLAKTEGEEFHTFLHKSSVFRQPVEFAAYEKFGTKELAQTGVNLTLFESEEQPGHSPLYWVTPVLREQMWKYLTHDEKTEMHHLAYKWYDEKIKEKIKIDKLLDYKYIGEAVYHGLESKNIRGACKHAIVLGNYLNAMVLYREQVYLQLQVAEMITDEIIEEAINEKDGNVAVLMNNLGDCLHTLGKNEKAIEYYEKALASDLKTYGPDHPQVAIRWNNLGATWNSLGKYDKTIEYFEKALASGLKTYGSDHPDVALRWDNLGLAWHSLGKYEKAIEYHEKALASDLKTYGPDHPAVATSWNNLGSAWVSLGKYEKAIEYFEKALASGLKTYGPDHPSVAASWNNLGLAWKALGKNEKAIEYYEKALRIFQKKLGNDQPSTQTVKGNLDGLIKSKGNKS